MQKQKSKAGYIVYKTSATETTLLGGCGVCDNCNDYAPQGYLVPVLHRYICQQCFDKFDAVATYYPEDMAFEEETAKFYEAMIPMEKNN